MTSLVHEKGTGPDGKDEALPGEAGAPGALVETSSVGQPVLESQPDEPRRARCPNCQEELHGPWCYQCGQNQRHINRFFLSLLGESFEEVFALDSRVVKTIFSILFRPGFLTTEYFAGRRARYVPPLRLYLIASVLFFFMLSMQVFTTSESTPIKMSSSSAGLNITLDDDEVDQEAIDELAKTMPEVADEITKELDKLEAPEKPEAGEDEELAEFMEELDGMNFSWLSADANESLRERAKRQSIKANKLMKEDPWELVNEVLDVAPIVLFIILPIFALLLKIMYLGTGRYYSEHLILAVHNHSFLYIILIFDSLVIALQDSFPSLDYLRIAVQVWIPLYMFISLRTVYKQGYFVTGIKYILLGFSYNVIFFLGVGLAGVLGVMTL